MLFARRKRLEELAAREAAGESLWTAEFDQRARVKIVHAFRDAADSNYSSDRAYSTVRDLILRDEGQFYLLDQYKEPSVDLLGYVMEAPAAKLPTVIEAMSRVLNNQQFLFQLGWGNARVAGPFFTAQVNTVLREHRIAYELIDSEMVEIESLAMHKEVVAPVVRLLGSTQGLEAVEKAYRDALDELAGGKAGDAITDAGTALQEMLGLLGCEGNALGPLIKSAKSKGLLAGHDAPLMEAMEKALHWVSADRSEKGDAHSSAQPSLDDAWLTVHITGALILRLSKGRRD